MKLIRHLKTDWFRYGFETLAVIVGLLIAFALDNWSDTKKSTEQTRIFLDHISSNLSEDLDELIDLMAHVDSTIARSELLLNSFKTHKFEVLEATTYLTWLNLEKSFKVNKSGINALINSGRLELLSPHLNYKLQQYYALCDKLKEREDISNVFIREKYEPYFFDHFIEAVKLADVYGITEKYADDPRELILVDEAELIDNYQIEMRVLIRLVHTEAEKKLYLQLMEEAKDLVVNINREIGR